MTPALSPGELLPHFEVTAIGGERVRYDDLWQRRNVVVLALPGHVGEPQRAYANVVREALALLRPDDTTLVAFEGAVKGVPASTLVVADRWGEIVHVAALGADVSQWPPPQDVVEWAQFVRCKCPECPP